MKIKKVLSLVLSIVFIATLSFPTLATESRASAQIAMYDMDATAATDRIAVYFSIIGSGEMENIGCEIIYIYKMVNSRWILVHSKTENADGMTDKDAFFYTNTLRFGSERLEAYKVVVTVFAENAKGRDSRSETFFVTGQ